MPKWQPIRKVAYEEDLDPEFAKQVMAIPGGEHISKCIQCGTCTGSCPLSVYMDYTPRRIIAMTRAGFKKEVLGILDRMAAEPHKGAAMFRNRITTLQHTELWRDALTRFMAGKKGPVRPGLTRIVREWFTRTVPGPPA